MYIYTLYVYAGLQFTDLLFCIANVLTVGPGVA